MLRPVEPKSGYASSKLLLEYIYPSCKQWKKYLTTMQIAQFVIDLCVVYMGSQCISTPLERSSRLNVSSCFSFSAFSHFSFKYHPSALPWFGDCAGTEYAAMMGCLVLTSYLFLFINFYIQTYKKPARAVNKSVAVGNGVANGKAYVFLSLFVPHFFSLIIFTKALKATERS
jgi:fatty acid elongase 3